MIAKLVVWGEDRSSALNSLINCLSKYHVSQTVSFHLKIVKKKLSQITGLETNVNFLIDLASHEYFQKGDVHTGFIPQHFDTLFPTKTISNNVLAQAAIGLIINENNAALCNALRAGQLNDPFVLNPSFRINSSEIKTVRFNNEGKEEKISITQDRDGGFKVKVNDDKWQSVDVKTVKEEGRFSLKVNMDGSVFNYSVVITPETVTIFNEVI